MKKHKARGVQGVCLVCVCVCVTEVIDSFFYFPIGMNVAGFLLSIHTPLLTKGQSFWKKDAQFSEEWGLEVSQKLGAEISQE